MAASILNQHKELLPGSSFYSYELPALVQKIKNDCGWKLGDLKSITIVNQPDKKIILTALHSQTEIKSKQTGECVVFHVLEGILNINIHKQSTTLGAGQKFTLYNQTKYKLEALSETIFLIIVFPSVIK